MFTQNDAIITIAEDGDDSLHVFGKKVPVVGIHPADSKNSLSMEKSSQNIFDENESQGFIDDGTLTRTGELWHIFMRNPAVRYSIYIIPVAAALAIPLALFATKYADSRVGGIRLLGLFVWIEIVWVTLWISKLIAKFIPLVFQYFSGMISTGIRRYALVLRALEIPLSLFIWQIFIMAFFPIIRTFDKAYYNAHGDQIDWLNTLYNVCKATIGLAALYLVEKLLIQMVSINYTQKQFYDKIRENKKITRCIELMYDTSLRMYPDACEAFRQVDVIIHDTAGWRDDDVMKKGDAETLSFLTDLGWYGSKVTSIFGNMISDISGKQIFKPTSSKMVVEAALQHKSSCKALATRIFQSFAKPGAAVIHAQDILDLLGQGREHDSKYIFAVLDRDENGDVSFDEIVMLLEETTSTRQSIWKGACDIKDAIKILDRVLVFFVLILAFLIYAAFFSTFLASKYAQIWSTFTGLSFLFAATAGELFGACITVFIKHPYDVGDRIVINDVEMEVTKISLLYTIFFRLDNKRSIQIPNSLINGVWVENTTRSKDMREQYKFSVSSGTSFSDIELLRTELETFVAENKRDYQAESIDIQLLSVNNLDKLDLQIEIQHKSNWANEKLRAYRRSKFMCALLSAMRKVPIDGPGGSGPSQGSISKPNYSVTITNDVAEAAAEKLKADKLAKHMATPLSALPQASSTGLEMLPSLLRVRTSTWKS